MLYGNSKKIKDYIKNNIVKKFGEMSSLVYVSVRKSNQKIYNESLKIFAEDI